jgi:hypothetical protein
MKVKLMLQSKMKHWVGVDYIGIDQLTYNIAKWYYTNSSEKYAKLHLIYKKIPSLIDNDLEILGCYEA